MPSTVLVTGASGLLGRDVAKAFDFADWRVVGTGLTRANPPAIIKLDLQDGDSIRRVLDEVRPKVIIHSAANRFPDRITANPALGRAVNVAPTRLLAVEASKRSIFLIYISTDYVFSGVPGEAPYSTTASAAPTNAYGQTKYEGEVAVLEETGEQGEGGSSGSSTPTAVILRVPILYGHCEADDPSKSAIHPLVDAIYAAQRLEPTDPKIKVDDYALRYPTATEDVARVCVDIAKLYTSHQENDRHSLPRVLHFSAEQKFTKYQMCRLFAEEVLALPIDALEAWDSSADDGEEEEEKEKKKDGATVRPYDCHLDTTVLKKLGVDVGTQDFLAWWKRELRAFRH